MNAGNICNLFSAESLAYTVCSGFTLYAHTNVIYLNQDIVHVVLYTTQYMYHTVWKGVLIPGAVWWRISLPGNIEGLDNAGRTDWLSVSRYWTLGYWTFQWLWRCMARAYHHYHVAKRGGGRQKGISAKGLLTFYGCGWKMLCFAYMYLKAKPLELFNGADFRLKVSNQVSLLRQGHYCRNRCAYNWGFFSGLHS